MAETIRVTNDGKVIYGGFEVTNLVGFKNQLENERDALTETINQLDSIISNL